MSISAGSALKLAFTWEPSQKGIVFDCPQRHNAIFAPVSCFSVPDWVIFAFPVESSIIGPLAKSLTFTKLPPKLAVYKKEKAINIINQNLSQKQLDLAKKS